MAPSKIIAISQQSLLDHFNVPKNKKIRKFYSRKDQIFNLLRISKIKTQKSLIKKTQKECTNLRVKDLS